MPEHPGPRGRIPVRPDWLALGHEEALDPDLPIIDPHHHLWDRPRWRYLLDELRADLACGHRIVATVHLEAGAMHRADGPAHLRPVGETTFVAGIAAMSESCQYGPTRVAAGIVGYADLRHDRAAETLEAHVAAGGGRFRGIRQTATWDAEFGAMFPLSQAPEGLLDDAEFRRGFADLARLGLSFEAWGYTAQLPAVARLAAAFPDVPIIVNHLGGILGAEIFAPRLAATRAAWLRDIAALARLPNVAMKLGGLGMWMTGTRFHMSPFPPTSPMLAEAFRPWVEPAIEAFGPERCMFESNFPVDKGSFGYGVFWNACKRLTAGVSAEARAALFAGTAARVYRLD